MRGSRNGVVIIVEWGLLLLLIVLNMTSSSEVYTNSGYDNEVGQDAICWVAIAKDHAHHDEHDHEEDHDGDGHGEEYGFERNSVFRETHGHDDEFGSEIDEHQQEQQEQQEKHEQQHEHEHENEEGEEHGHEEGEEEEENDLVPSFQTASTRRLDECPKGIDLHLDGPTELGDNESILRTGRIYRFSLQVIVRLDYLRMLLDLPPDAFVYTTGGSFLATIRVIFCPVEGQFCTPFIFEHGDGHGSHDEHDEHDEAAHDEHDGHDEHDEHDGHDEHDEHDGHDEHEHGHDKHAEHAELDEHDEPGHDDHGHDDEHDSDSADSDSDSDSNDVRLDHDHEHSDHELVHKHVESIVQVVEFNNISQTTFRFNFEKEITIADPGNYLPLGTFQFFLANDTINGYTGNSTDPNALYRFDIANLMHERLVQYRPPLQINEVDTRVAIISYVSIAIVVISLLYLLASVIRHRKNPVIRLSQGNFLAVFLVCAIIATISAIFFQPGMVCCRVYGPLIFISIQIMLAITIGRFRRIIFVMSPLMNWNANHYGNRRAKRNSIANPNTFKRLLPVWLRTSSTSGEPSKRSESRDSKHDQQQHQQKQQHTWRRNKNRTGIPTATDFIETKKSLRAEFTASQLLCWAVIVTTPQIIVQFISAVFYPESRTLLVNDDQSIGRYRCENPHLPYFRFTQVVVVYTTLLYLVLESQRTRQLPSLFDEAAAMSSAILMTLVVSTVGIIAIAVSGEPTASPDAEYIMLVAITLCLTSNLSFRLILPKLKLIWKGEKVLVGKILRDHKAKISGRTSTGAAAAAVVAAAGRIQHLTKTDYTKSTTKASKDRKKHFMLKDDLSAFEINNNINDVGGGGDGRKNHKDYYDDDDDNDNDYDVEAMDVFAPLPSEHKNSSTNRIISSSSSFEENNNNNNNHSILSSSEGTTTTEQQQQQQYTPSTLFIISEDETPPKEVTFNLVQHAELVDRISRRMMSGLQVPQEEWEHLLESLQETNSFFARRVMLDWRHES